MQRRQPENWATTRKYRRSLLDLRLIVKTKETLHGRTKNLGEGGMGATVAGDIPMGEFVELQFIPPEATEPLVIRAEVRYRQGFQYGFKFIRPTQAAGSGNTRCGPQPAARSITSQEIFRSQLEEITFFTQLHVHPFVFSII